MIFYSYVSLPEGSCFEFCLRIVYQLSYRLLAHLSCFFSETGMKRFGVTDIGLDHQAAPWILLMKPFFSNWKHWNRMKSPGFHIIIEIISYNIIYIYIVTYQYTLGKLTSMWKALVFPFKWSSWQGGAVDGDQNLSGVQFIVNSWEMYEQFMG